MLIAHSQRRAVCLSGIRDCWQTDVEPVKPTSIGGHVSSTGLQTCKCRLSRGSHPACLPARVTVWVEHLHRRRGHDVVRGIFSQMSQTERCCRRRPARCGPRRVSRRLRRRLWGGRCSWAPAAARWVDLPSLHSARMRLRAGGGHMGVSPSALIVLTHSLRQQHIDTVHTVFIGAHLCYGHAGVHTACDAASLRHVAELALILVSLQSRGRCVRAGRDGAGGADGDARGPPADHVRRPHRACSRRVGAQAEGAALAGHTNTHLTFCRVVIVGGLSLVQ